MFCLASTIKTGCLLCGKAELSHLSAVCICSEKTHSSVLTVQEPQSSFPLSRITHNPNTTVDFKATFGPQETRPRHLFVCTSGYAVSLLDHSARLCFNTGWTLNHTLDLSTLIHFLICLIAMRDLIEHFCCT